MERFPNDFMFELTQEASKILRSPIVTSSWGGTRYPPFAFTEHGVAMLSSILNSPKAIQTNVAIEPPEDWVDWTKIGFHKDT